MTIENLTKSFSKIDLAENNQKPCNPSPPAFKEEERLLVLDKYEMDEFIRLTENNPFFSMNALLNGSWYSKYFELFRSEGDAFNAIEECSKENSKKVNCKSKKNAKSKKSIKK